MHIKKTNFKSFSSIGIFCAVSDKIALIPIDASAKFEELVKDVFEVETIKATIGESNLLGVLSKIYNKKVVISKITTDKELAFFEDIGLNTLKLNSYHAVGNMIAVNKNNLLLSKMINDDGKKEISAFMGLDYDSFNLCNTELVGSVVAATNMAFVCGASIKETEFEKVKNLFKVDGNVGTINYGESFVSSGLLVNSKGLMVGEDTTGYELMRLDEIFRE